MKEIVRSQPAELPAYPDGLSGREVEVLSLIASGKSNREISEVLFISQNTVARHVSNIFSKTGSSNRADAAVYANRNGFNGDIVKGVTARASLRLPGPAIGSW